MTEEHPSLDLALEEAEFIRNSLTQCGFIINSEKSVWQPQKELIWLGIKMHLIHSRFTITEDRILSIMESIQFIIKKNYHIPLLKVSLNSVAKIITTKFVVENIA